MPRVLGSHMDTNLVWHNLQRVVGMATPDYLGTCENGGLLADADTEGHTHATCSAWCTGMVPIDRSSNNTGSNKKKKKKKLKQHRPNKNGGQCEESQQHINNKIINILCTHHYTLNLRLNYTEHA